MGEIKFHVLTLFPEMIRQGLAPSIIGRAVEKGIISLNAVDIRDHTLERHRKVDDYSYGGGAGMLLQAQPVFDAHRAVTGGRALRTVYVTPQGTPFTQEMARELAGEKEIVFLCGHYEGVDERVLEEIVTDYVSIGDYVLTGGELAAMVMIDAVARLVPGVLGNELSWQEESFDNDLLEYPQYSRPEVWRGKKVPKVLLSGNHRQITAWRLEQSEARTSLRRPDLYERYLRRRQLAGELARDKRCHIHMMESLAEGRCEILYAGQGDVLLYDRKAGVCMGEAAREESCEILAGLVPQEAGTVVTSHPLIRDLLLKGGFQPSCEYIQVLYTRRVSLPVKREIRRLTMESLEEIRGFCQLDGLEDSIRAGALYGAFEAGRPVGAAGLHREGRFGMLFVEETSRRQGFGTALTACVVNLLLEKGSTPYGHVPAENQGAWALLEKLGFYRAGKSFWRLEKKLANRPGIW